MRGIKKSRKNSIPNIHRGEYLYISPEILESKILGGGSYQTFPENLNNSKNFGEGSYQTSPENLNNSKSFGEGSYQTSPEELNNSGIAEKNFHTSLLNSTPVDCKEINNRISLRNATQVCQRELKEKSSTLGKIKLPRVGIPAKNDNHQNDSCLL